MILGERQYRVGIFTLLVEREFESSRIALSGVFGQLGTDLRLFVLLNGPENTAIRTYFQRLRHVEFLCAGRNLGVAGGRNLLTSRAMKWGADILVSYDNDFVPPRDYFGRICGQLVDLSRHKRVGIIAPGLVNGNHCRDFWEADYQGIANQDESAGNCLSFELEHLRRYLAGRIASGHHGLFYHLGIRHWRVHYLRSNIALLERFRQRLRRVVPAIPPAIPYRSTTLAHDPAVQQQVIQAGAPVVVDTLPGGAHCYFASLLRELAGYDENFNPFGFEDADLCIRAVQAGYSNYLIPSLLLIHDIAQRHHGRRFVATCQLKGKSRRLFLSKYSNGPWHRLIDLAYALVVTPVEVARHARYLHRIPRERMDWKETLGAILGYLGAFALHRHDRSIPMPTLPVGPKKVLFMPHNAYHTFNMSHAVPFLRKAGMECVFVNVDEAYRGEGARKEMERLRLSYLDYGADILDRLRPDLVVVMNDWGGVVHQTVLEANHRLIPTVAIVEGVQDFEDTHVAHIGVGRIRKPYRHAKYALLIGEYDRKFLTGPNTRLMGIPRLEPLLKEAPLFPDKPLVAINCNFTYGIYTQQREDWLDSCIQACRQAGLDYVITQHPADDSDLSAYKVTKDPIYNVLRQCTVMVSRFSTVLLEAMALGKPVVYHNLHDERMDTFREPQGAYRITRTAQELADALLEALRWTGDYRQRCRKFFSHHVSVQDKPSSQRLAEALLEILATEPQPVQVPPETLPQFVEPPLVAPSQSLAVNPGSPLAAKPTTPIKPAQPAQPAGLAARIGGMAVQIIKWHLRWGGLALVGALALFGVAFSGLPGALYAGLAGVCLISATMAFVFTRGKAEASDRVRAEAKRLDDRCQDRQHRQGQEIEVLRAALGDARKELEQAIQEGQNRQSQEIEDLRSALGDARKEFEQAIQEERDQRTKTLSVLDERSQDRQNRQGQQIEDLRSALGDARKELERAIQEERDQRTESLFVKPYQPFLRQLREDDIQKLVRVWAPRLGVEVTYQQLRYVQHRIAFLEDLCLGRLAGHVHDVALRILAARGLGGQELHIIEIGALFGVNAIILYDLLSCYYRRVQLTLIDPLEGYYGSGSDGSTGLPVSRYILERNLRQMGVPSENWRIVQRSSHDPEVLTELGDRTCQFLFIDGDHSYEGVRNDLERFAPLVSNGGLVVFHDYHSHNWPDVTRAVDKLAMARKDLELVGAEWETAIFRKRLPDSA